jgi:glutaredoxin
VPCDNGRRLLQQRGVPYAERVITSADDAAALERTVGGRSVPALTIGTQPLRGLSEADWTAYLDAAGYPRESRLPRGWQPPPPAPLVERAPARPAAEAPAPRPPPALPAEPPPGTLRF